MDQPGLQKEIEMQLAAPLAPGERAELLMKLFSFYQPANHPETEAVITEAMELSLQAGDRHLWARAGRSKASYLETKGRYKEALEILQEILPVFRETRDSEHLVPALINYGKIFVNLGDYSRALDFFEEALRFSSDTQDIKGEAMTLNSLSVVHQRAMNGKRAEEYARRSLDLGDGLNDNKLRATALINLGNSFGVQERWDDARAAWERSKDIAVKENYTNILASVYGNLGIALEKTGHLEEAEEYIFKTYELKKRMGDVFDMARSLQNIARVRMKRGRDQQAESDLFEALSLIDSTKARSVHKDIYRELYTIYKSRKDLEKALMYFEMFHDAEKEIFSEDMTVKTESLQIRYEIDKIEKENEIYRLKNIDLASANEQITLQKEEIERKNKDITDSIRYAERIQKSLLPPQQIFQNYFSYGYILNIPRDIISGDFYWALPAGDTLYFAVADCTGHGVPGALMSVMGGSFLSEIINERGITDPGEALNVLRLKVITALHGHETESKDEQSRLWDGMDIILCRYEKRNFRLTYSCANNPIWLIRNHELLEGEVHKFPVGRYHGETRYFRSSVIDLQENDQVYLFTDGYADQFGGDRQKKFGYKRMRDFFSEIRMKPDEEKGKLIRETWMQWKSDLEQVDDVLLLHLRV